MDGEERGQSDVKDRTYRTEIIIKIKVNIKDPNVIKKKITQSYLQRPKRKFNNLISLDFRDRRTMCIFYECVRNFTRVYP